MEFYTSFCEPRPVRLCEETRRFAYASLYEHTYGLDTQHTPAVSLDAVEGFAALSGMDQYDAAIYEIVSKAPIRICPAEKISGAATLGNAIRHMVPATYRGNPVFSSVSHLTLDFAKVLKVGVDGIEQEAGEAYAAQTDPKKRRFLESCLHCIRCFRLWHGRYIEALTALDGYGNTVSNLKRVPFSPARNFYEAVQSLWFTFAFTRLCGNWPGIGRIDQMLGPYLKNDLEHKTITLSEAREILAHFFIKGCEWVTGDSCDGGDAQHYQNLVLAGVDETGAEVTNEVTYLILDIVEELGISDFPITVRIGRHTDTGLIHRVAEVMRYGNGVLAVYNEDLVLRSLEDFGYSQAEARGFANDGCWEVQIPGKTCFTYIPFDSLAVLQHITLQDYAAETDIFSFEELYARYISDLKQQIGQIYTNVVQDLGGVDALTGAWRWKEKLPCTVVSLFEEGCIQNGASYFEGGPVYTVRSPHIGGVADTVNSLYTIQKLVFEEKKVSFRAFMEILRNNWAGNEELRQYVRRQYAYYGNDNDEVDLLAARLLNDFADACFALNGQCPIQFPPGVSTFGRQIEWADTRKASAHGRKQGEILAGNLSPTPGTGTKGATAIIRSHCKADLSRQTTGAALDIRLLPADVKGRRGIEAIGALIRGFVSLGGFFMQINVADAEILKEAQRHPEEYRSLAVRVSGWNARFVTFSQEWQDMVIQSMAGEGS